MVREGPLVSIVCITFNQEKYISQTIEGFLNQRTSFGFEIIIGEDCSTDNTRNIISAYRKKYPKIIKIISSDQNVGMNQNFIRCMEATNGKYIAYCDGDDYWICEDKLEEQVNFLENNIEYGLVYTDCHYCYENRSYYIKNVHRKFNFRETANFQNLLFVTQICASTALFNKSLYDSYKKSEDFSSLKTKYCGDTIMWLNFSGKSLFKFQPKSSTIRRIFNESGSRSDNADIMLEHFKDRYEVSIYFAHKNRCDSIIINKIHEFYYRKCLVLLNRKNKIRKANEYYKLLKDSELNKPSDALYKIPYFLFIYEMLWKILSTPYYRICLVMKVYRHFKMYN